MNIAIYASIAGFLADIGTLQAVLFILGLLLLVVEMFIPGFGVAGGSGVVMLLAAIIMTAQTPLQALIMVLVLIAVIALVLVVVLRSAKYGKLSKKLILNSTSNREDGYSTTSIDSSLIGKEGVALSLLRPSGMGEFDEQRIDVVSEGTYIEAGTKIKIVSIEGRRIVVKPLD